MQWKYIYTANAFVKIGQPYDIYKCDEQKTVQKHSKKLNILIFLFKIRIFNF